jgi:hypothetical protein
MGSLAGTVIIRPNRYECRISACAPSVPPDAWISHPGGTGQHMKRGLTQGTSRRLTRLSPIDIPLAAAVAALPAVLLAAHLPPDLLMPAMAVLAFATALVASVAGWLTRASRQAATVTIWDFAGACVLIGIAAGTFSETVQVSQLLGIATTTP